MRYLLLALLFVPASAVAADSDETEAILRLAAARRARDAAKPKVSVPTKPYNYAETMRRVTAGQKLSLAVGVLDEADGYVESLPGINPGVYDCYMDGTKPMMALRGNKAAAPKVEVPLVPKAETPGTSKVTGARPAATRPLQVLAPGWSGGTPRTVTTITSAPWTALGGPTSDCPPSG